MNLYLIWLLAISLFFVLVERLWSVRKPQPLFRRQLANDLSPENSRLTPV